MNNLIFTKKFKVERKTLENICDFLNDRITKEEFLEFYDEDELNEEFEKVSLEEFKNCRSYLHEMAHIDIWKKYGVDFVIVKHKLLGNYGVGPINLRKIHNATKKQTIVKILKEVYKAPYEIGIVKGTELDLVEYEALSGNIDILTTKDQAIKLIHEKYGNNIQDLEEALA